MSNMTMNPAGSVGGYGPKMPRKDKGGGNRRPGKDPNLGGGSSGGSSYSGGGSSYSSYSGGGGYGGGYGGGGGGGGGSSTHTTTNLSSRAEARAVLYAGLESILGRRPLKGEVDAYFKALGKFEKKHPTTTTTSGDTTTSTGGVSATMGTQFTQDWVKKDPDLKAEKGSYDMATKYMDAFISAIAGPRH